jgi:hypothetical protein
MQSVYQPTGVASLASPGLYERMRDHPAVSMHLPVKVVEAKRARPPIRQPATASVIQKSKPAVSV